jgi:cytidylate kinase
MDHMTLLKKYIREKEDTDIINRGYPFVTISRLTGAGGHVLARDILGEMENHAQHNELFQGWDLFDQTVCALVLQDPEIKSSFDSLVKEEYRSERQQILYDMMTGRSQQYATYKRIFEIVRILATLGKAIIIGRAGVCATRDMPNGIHIRLIASEETRIRTVMKEENLDAHQAEKLMKKRDKEREHLIRDFFNVDVNESLLFDATFNIDKQSTADLAALIIQMIKLKAKKAR